MGPWIAHAEPEDDPSALGVKLLVNGELMQDGSTANLIFSVAELIAHFARVLTLEPGDVIATGTPAGVGAGRTPPRFLSPGDRVEARVEGAWVARDDNHSTGAGDLAHGRQRRSRLSKLNEPASEAPPVAVAKLAIYEAHSADVARLASYYEDVLQFAVSERTKDAVYLTTGNDHHCTVVRAGEPNGRARLGFEIHGSLDDAGERLQARGVAFERASDPEPGIAASLTLTEPGSGTPLSLFEHPQPSGVASAIALRPTKLGHVASYVPDLLETQRFYIDVLGLRWSDTIGDFFTFLRCNADHHAINLMGSTKKSGLFHVAYEMRDFMQLKDALDNIATFGYSCEWGPGRHGVGHNIFSYHRDVDGNLVELFTEIDIIYDEENGWFEPRPWHETWPQGPKVWDRDPTAANKWGWINPAMLDH